jgi:hypothetical protein
LPDASPRQGLKEFRFAKVQSTFLGTLDDTLRDRVLGIVFNCRCDGERVVRCEFLARGDLDNAKFAAGQRARLVKTPPSRGALPRVPAGHESAAAARAERRRDRNHQGMASPSAGTGNHEPSQRVR